MRDGLGAELQNLNKQRFDEFKLMDNTEIYKYERSLENDEILVRIIETTKQLSNIFMEDQFEK